MPVLFLVARERHRIHCRPFTRVKAVTCFRREYVVRFFALYPLEDPCFITFPARVVHLLPDAYCKLTSKLSILLLITSPSVVCKLRKKQPFFACNVHLRCTKLHCHCGRERHHAHWSASTAVKRYFLQII